MGNGYNSECLLHKKKKRTDMEEIKKEPKYYNENRRKATQKYRQKRQTIQCTLTFKTWKKMLIDEQAKKRGTNINRYFLGTLEKDAKGQVYVIPDITAENAADLVREVAETKTVKTDHVKAVLRALSKTDAKALGELAADAGLKKEDLIKSLLVCICMEMTYTGAETILESMEAYGAERSTVIAAIKEAGISPAFPAQCALTEIEDPEKKED